MRFLSQRFVLVGILLLSVSSVSIAGTLPDFTSIVKENAPAVVNVQATIVQRNSLSANGQQAPNLFRFFGFPFPPQMPRNRQEISMGSGFILSSDGYILTNDHVINGAKKVTVTLASKRVFTAKVVGYSKTYDIALLKIKATGLPTVKIGNSANLKAGQWVLAIGSPFGFDHTVTAGIVSAVGRAFGPADQRYTAFVQTDVPINRGNSGGPLFNLQGQVVGINSQIYSNTGGFMGVSFAIPIDVAMHAVRQIKKYGHVERGLLGVVMQQVTPNLAKSYGLSEVKGALVSKVEPNSPAAKAGIKRGDIIQSFNGSQVDSVQDLAPMVGLTQPGTMAKVEIFRQGKMRTLRVKIGKAPRGKAGIMQGELGNTGNSLGVVVQTLTPQQRQQMNLSAGQGVVITRVIGNTAQQAGVRPGDVILSVDNRPVGSVAQFHRELGRLKRGAIVRLLLQRDNFNLFVALPLGGGSQ